MSQASNPKIDQLSHGSSHAKNGNSSSHFSLQDWFRKARYYQIVLLWLGVIVLFSAIFSAISYMNGADAVLSTFGVADGRGVITESLIFSFSNAVLLGFGKSGSLGVARLFVVLELFVALVLYALLISRIFLASLHLWPSMFDNAKNKKVNTIALMFSIYRHDVDSIIHKLEMLKSSTLPKNLTKDLEAASEELYLGLLEVEVLLTTQGRSLAAHHLLLLLHNVEASLGKTKELLHSMASHKIKYASKTFVFNLKYSADLTDKISKKYREVGAPLGSRVENYFSSINELREEIKGVV